MSLLADTQPRSVQDIETKSINCIAGGCTSQQEHSLFSSTWSVLAVSVKVDDSPALITTVAGDAVKSSSSAVEPACRLITIDIHRSSSTTEFSR